MERGYVKLWRRTLDSGLLQHPTAWQVFGYLLMKTAARPFKRVVAGQSVEVPVGAVLTSRSSISSDLGITEKQVRGAMAILEKMEIVSITRASKYSMVFLVNWHRYQQSAPAEGPGKGQQTAPHHLNNKERENIKKKVPKEKPDVLEGLSDRMRGAVQAFSEHRKGMKAPLTEQALKLTLSKVEQLAPGNEAAQVAILEQSVQRGWKGVFALKEEGQAAMPTPRYEWQSPAQRRLNANMEAAQAFIHDG